MAKAVDIKALDSRRKMLEGYLSGNKGKKAVNSSGK